MAFPKRLRNYIIKRQLNGRACYEQSVRFLAVANAWSQRHEKYTSGAPCIYTTQTALAAVAHLQRLSAMHYAEARRMQGIGKRIVTIQFVVSPVGANAEGKNG